MPDQSAPPPLRAHAWVVANEPVPAGRGEAALTDESPLAAEAAEVEIAEVAETAETDETDGSDDEFARRVEERLRVARYAHNLKRVVYSPTELADGREIEQQAAVWVPIVTFTATAVCAVIVVLLATSIAGDPEHGRLSEALVVLATVGLLVAGFSILTRSQDYFDARRPTGRLIRTDLADAYETIRDAAAVLVELGVPPAALSRVADLLPQAERLVDHLVDHEACGGVVRTHPAYERVLLMGAEVTVLTDMAEERLGRRSTRRRDRARGADHDADPATEDGLTPFDTLSDLVAMLGPDLPGPRLPRPYDV